MMTSRLKLRALMITIKSFMNCVNKVLPSRMINLAILEITLSITIKKGVSACEGPVIIDYLA